MDKVLELNRIMDEEIKFCEEFEYLLLQKKDSLIHLNHDKLKEFDEKIYAAHQKLQFFTQNRKELNKKFGKEQAHLSELIDSVEDKNVALQLNNKRLKMQQFIKKITATNIVVNSLIEHSMKLIDGSVMAIAKAMSEKENKGDYYNSSGRKDVASNVVLSAIVEDA